jgi:hypothetical protein
MDRYRGEWTGNPRNAEWFYARHEAEGIASMHGGQAIPLREALDLDAAE